MSHSNTGTAKVLDDVHVDVHAGELVGVIGPNGAGKTTLLRLLSGYLIPGNGSIELFGKDLRTYEKRRLAQLVATLPQTIATIFPYTAEEFILMGDIPISTNGSGTIAERRRLLRT